MLPHVGETGFDHPSPQQISPQLRATQITSNVCRYRGYVLDAGNECLRVQPVECSHYTSVGESVLTSQTESLRILSQQPAAVLQARKGSRS